MKRALGEREKDRSAADEMAKNKFKIPDDVLAAIRARDVVCAYCRKEMVFPYSKLKVADSVTIEHLNREGPFY